MSSVQVHGPTGRTTFVRKELVQLGHPQVARERDITQVIPSGAKVLGVWAHPDDEAFVAAGALADAVDRGCDVTCVYATSGEQGWQHTPDRRDGLGTLRNGELNAALDALGIRRWQLLGYPDGGLAAVPEDAAVARLLAIVDEVAPDVVLTFGPDGFTGHPDHMAVSAWCAAAVERSARRTTTLWHTAVSAAWVQRYAPALDRFAAFWPGYPIASAPGTARPARLDRRVLDRKIAALRAHRSQTAHLFAAYGEPFIRAMMGTEWFVPAGPPRPGALPLPCWQAAMR